MEETTSSTPDENESVSEQKLLRRTVLKTTAVGAGLATAAGHVAVGDENDEDNDDEEDASNAEEDEEYEDEDDAMVIFPNQVTDGSSINIEVVRLPEGGFVSIVDPVAAHEELWPIEGEMMPELDELIAAQIRGVTDYLEAGEHEDIHLEPEEPLEAEKLYQVWVHQDTTGDETFSFVDSVGAEDSPYPTEFGPDPDADDPTREGEADEATGETETIEPGTAIELDGQTGGWVGISPDEIAGETNPQISLAEGESYEMGWTTGDGQGHNLVIQDEDGGTVDDLATDVETDPGDDQWLEFEASEEMDTYLCTPHAGTMNGEITVVGEEEETDDDDDNEAEVEDDNNDVEDEMDDETDEDEAEEPAETQAPPITMGDAYLHRLDDDTEIDEDPVYLDEESSTDTDTETENND
ncbi:DUF7282 domain-containing protein [Natrialba sp. SSL1]|uniref:DUF7282 domain-containing protein n=1 Tax=Natrialba sp. SSL1 TaxID=1869245 RepID=UPI0008F90341|nr:plastocyanin/azurin family copper-binding protein [Natrialba sp. SSL1]OIB58090.1 hypothetical protein BBD46_10545 [Natrialba sp. SSL1]